MLNDMTVLKVLFEGDPSPYDLYFETIEEGRAFYLEAFPNIAMLKDISTVKVNERAVNAYVYNTKKILADHGYSYTILYTVCGVFLKDIALFFETLEEAEKIAMEFKDIDFRISAPKLLFYKDFKVFGVDEKDTSYTEELKTKLYKDTKEDIEFIRKVKK